MGIRSARQSAIAIGLAAGWCLAVAAPARAQQPPAPSQAETPPVGKPAAQPLPELFQLSGSCNAPDSSVTSLAPLPHLAAVLQQTQTVRVLAIGNWAAAGLGGRHRFTSELEEILERSVKGLDLVFTHRGVSGELVNTTAERLKQEIALLDPDLVLWQVGSNDALMRVSVAEFEASLSAAVEWVKAHDKDLVLVGLQYTKALSRNDHYRAIKDAVGRVAARHNVLLVRRYEAVQFMATASREQDRLAKDEFMMTELGYKCMSEHIARALVVNVFARRATEAKAGKVAEGQSPGRPSVPAARAAEAPIPSASAAK